MNKKVTITLLVLAIVLIPITIMAGSYIIEEIKVVPDLIVPDNNLSTTESFDNIILSKDNELDEKLAEANKINEAENKKIEEIINRFYSKEFEKLKEEAANPDNLSSNGYYTDKNPEPIFYNLVLDIIEYKDLTEDEFNTLKVFMLDQESNIHNRPEIIARIKKLCE